MVSDQEPRYRLVDDEGNIVGSLYGKPDGSVAIQETDSGSDREVALAPDGTFSAPSVETDSVSTGSISTDHIVDVRDFDSLDDAVSNTGNQTTIKLEPATTYSGDTLDLGRSQGVISPIPSRRNSDAAILDYNSIETGANTGVFFINVEISGVDVNINNDYGYIRDCYALNSNITVGANRCKITGLDAGSVTFEQGSENNIIDSCTRTSVTDNGSNTVGDIA